MSFDLSTLVPSDTAVVQITHPTTGKPLEGVTVTIYGKDSDTFEKLSNKNLRKRLKKRNQIPDPAEIHASNVETVAGCIIAWTGMVENGQELPFSKENAIKLMYTYKWMYEQLDEAIGSRLDFLET